MDIAELMEKYPEIPDYPVSEGIARDIEYQLSLPLGTLDFTIDWRHRSDKLRMERNETR